MVGAAAVVEASPAAVSVLGFNKFMKIYDNNTGLFHLEITRETKMNIRTIILIIAALVILGAGASVVLATGNGDRSSPDGILMQDSGDEASGGDSEGGDDASGDEGSTDESGAETEPVVGEPVTQPPVGDILAGGVDDAEKEQNIQDALAGIRDYEVSYKTSLSREELTPPELKALDGTIYAGEESSVAARTKLLNELDILGVLSNRYEKVEEEFGAKAEEDFDEEDPDKTLNYYQPRGDPFVITDWIPEELRPKMEGTGLDGAVDPELLEELFWANFQAQLRLVDIYIIGTMESGPNKICMFTIFGIPRSFTIMEGESTYFGFFRIDCVQVSEDFVVFILSAGDASVTRTFHVRR